MSFDQQDGEADGVGCGFGPRREALVPLGSGLT
jgi:hypothetical protein